MLIARERLKISGCKAEHILPVVVTTMNIVGKVMEATSHPNCFRGAAEWNKMY